MLTILDATTAANCAAATSRQDWSEALIAAWSGGNVTARLFAPDGTTLRRTLTLAPFAISGGDDRSVTCGAHLADTAVSTGSPGLWVFRAGSTDIFSIDAGVSGASVNHPNGNIKALCTPTLAGVTFTPATSLPVSSTPAWRAAMSTPLAWYSVATNVTIGDLDPADDPLTNPNHPSPAPWNSAAQSQIFNSWGTMVYNRATKRAKGIGGGHLGYSGNEVYDLLMSTDVPQRSRSIPSGSIQRPATFVGGYPSPGTNIDVCDDERPRAIHPYGVCAQDDAGRFFQMPGGAANDEDGVAWTRRAFRFVNGDWDLTGPPETTRYFAGPGAAVYDAEKHVIWHLWGATTFQYDPETLEVLVRTVTDGALYYGVAVIAGDYVCALNTGGSGSDFLRLFVFDRDAPGTYGYHRDGTGGSVAITGTPPPWEGQYGYGMDWDPARGRLLLCNGGPQVFSLTPPASGSWVTNAWSWAELSTSTAVYTPPDDTGNGLFNRVWVDPDYNTLTVQLSDVEAPLSVLLLEDV